MKDYFKRETMLGFTEWDLNSKWVIVRSRKKDSQMVKRSARRKLKEKLKEDIKNLDQKGEVKMRSPPT